MEEVINLKNEDIQVVTTKELIKEKKNMNSQKAPGLDLVTGEVLKCYLRKVLLYSYICLMEH